MNNSTNIIEEINEDTILVSGQVLTESLARQISYKDHEFCEVVFTETDYDTLYKDYANCEVVFKHNAKLWCFDYQSYESHYGSGESMYYDCKIQEVEYYEEEITTIQKGYRAV